MPKKTRYHAQIRNPDGTLENVEVRAENPQQARKQLHEKYGARLIGAKSLFGATVIAKDGSRFQERIQAADENEARRRLEQEHGPGSVVPGSIEFIRD